MLEDIKTALKNIETRLQSLRGFLDLSQKEDSIRLIQNQINEPDFWSDFNKSNKLMKEMKYLKSCIDPFETSLKKVSDLKELAEICDDDQDMVAQIKEESDALAKDLEALETKSLLSGQFDKNNAILSINAGAGGTESCDWASMLLRMYIRWGESNGHSVKVLDTLDGEEAGIKSATISVSGDMVYGYLKSEKGVHRLVRISPFDSNSRRHTSFASVDVIPEIEDDIDVEINQEDLRIDIFRSSGPGGQSVNTTDSAVRLTHTPTGIVVQCQNERSQLQNKQAAMRVLRARIYEIKLKEQEEKLSKEYGSKQKIEWGSQIRSYVMHPYNMVKDHRTEAETGNVAKIMDGGLGMFMEAFLRMK
ncbi:MAG: peptide chain release factor 2 [Candidatus Zapsychrus exili]|nr:peptide chain release factor 2 [Candidatus Zapsychrus exili]